MPKVSLHPRRVLLSGQLRVGKDYVAKLFKSKILGFADPIYTIVDSLYGSPCDKSAPGVRTLYRNIGQWGRGLVNDQYPITAERLLFVQTMRIQGHDIVKYGFPYTWATYGLDPLFWVKLLTVRARNFDRVIVTNARFEHEVALATLHDDPWTHYHVMCSEETRRERIEALGEKYEAPDYEKADVSEKLAIKLDEDVNKGLYPAELVIWNDHRPSPNPLFTTIGQLEELAKETV